MSVSSLAGKPTEVRGRHHELLYVSPELQSASAGCSVRVRGGNPILSLLLIGTKDSISESLDTGVSKINIKNRMSN